MSEVEEVALPSRPALSGVEIGPGVGIIGPLTVALFEPMNADLADRVWRLVSEGAGANDLLEAVSGEGLRTLGAFAFAHREGDTLHIVVRRTAWAEVSDGGVGSVVRAGNVHTWVEMAFSGDATFCLRLEAAAEDFDSPFVMSSGVVPAVAVHSAPPTRLRDLSVVTSTPAVESGAILIPAPSSPSSQSAPTELVPHSTDSTEAAPVASVLPDSLNSPVDLHATLARPSEEEPSLPPPMAAAEQLPDSKSSYDDIYGATVARSVQMAAVPAHDAAEGLIDQVPPDAGEPALKSELAGDHDGRTITRAQLGALRGVGSGAAMPVGAPAGGPIVQAALCSSQHPNPPAAAMCRVCGGPVAQTLVNVVRPPLGVLRFSTGAQTRLDRPLLIGRNPKVSGMLGGELPEAVQLDVGSGLSRTHLAVRLEGWQVLVEDLNSANGTVVSLPGQLPRRLHPGEPVLLEPGSSVDLGGDASFEFALR